MTGNPQEFQPRVFPQPPGAPEGLGDLVFDESGDAERFDRLEPFIAGIDGRFLAAAVFEDEAGDDYYDSDLTTWALNLAAAHDELANGAGVPVIFIGDEDLAAGESSVNSGLFLTEHESEGTDAHIPVQAGIKATFDEDAESPEMKVWESGIDIVNFETPYRVLTPRNLVVAPEYSDGYLGIGTLMIGEKAVFAFFEAVTAADTTHAREAIRQQERDVALAAISTLHDRGFSTATKLIGSGILN